LHKTPASPLAKALISRSLPFVTLARGDAELIENDLLLDGLMNQTQR
jgi:hypothetical protein